MIVLAATNPEELEKEWECLTELIKLGGSTSLMELYASRRLMTSLTDVCFTFHSTFLSYFYATALLTSLLFMQESVFYLFVFGMSDFEIGVFLLKCRLKLQNLCPNLVSSSQTYILV